MDACQWECSLPVERLNNLLSPRVKHRGRASFPYAVPEAVYCLLFIQK